MKGVLFVTAFIFSVFVSTAQTYYYGTNMGLRWADGKVWPVFTTDSLFTFHDDSLGNKQPTQVPDSAITYDIACFGDVICCFYPDLNEWMFHQVSISRNIIYSVWTVNAKTGKRTSFKINEYQKNAEGNWVSIKWYKHDDTICHHDGMKCF